MSGAIRITARDVEVSLDGHEILKGVTLDIMAGEVLALVGPNGAGKSTLLGVLSGDSSPTAGHVSYDGRAIRDHRALELARIRSVLTQENVVSFPFRVRQVVEMGRNPWAKDALGDEADIVDDALATTDVLHLAERRFTSLSGGEKARASLARVLAQHTPIVFLDEPTAALDLKHQEDVMKVARRLAAEGSAVIVVLHDLSLAGAYADRIALLARGRLSTVGTPDEVLTAEQVRDAYGLDVQILRQPETGRPIVLPVRAAH